MKSEKTNAMRLLERLKIPYQPQHYAVEDGAIDGLAVAAKTGRDPQQVYKTLVAKGASGAVLVFCIPVAQALNLKQAAKAAGEKSLAMAPLAQITPLTGYVRGGVSPLGMKKAYPVYLYADALQQPHILVSGGRIGLQIELAPQDLIRAVNATLFGPWRSIPWARACGHPSNPFSDWKRDE
ncbi:MAG: Cys-tRNA(Pro) deacylase [Oscillospiraceae bacterium]